MRAIITTVGTSLLTNFRKARDGSEPAGQALANFLRHTPAEQASAETNSLYRLLKEDDGIIFLHSTTDEGSICADCLSSHYSSMGYESSSLVIPDLTYQESRFKMRGLRSLVSRIIDLIKTERDQGNEIVINATGGFKAEIAYATLIGLLFDVPVFYIHEAFKEIIEMPPVPISWDYSLIADHDEFFDWLVADLRPAPEADARIKGLPSEVRFLLTEEDGYTLLSPVGDVFFEAYRMKAASLEAVPVFLSEKAWRSLEAATPDERKLLDKTIRKLRDPILRRNGSEQKNNSDCLVYPKGHRPERTFYYEDENGLAYVCDLTARHDVYERLLDKGGVWRRNYGGFSKL